MTVATSLFGYTIVGLAIGASVPADTFEASNGIYSEVATCQGRIHRLLVEGVIIFEDANQHTRHRFRQAVAKNQCFLELIHNIDHISIEGAWFFDPSWNRTWWTAKNTVSLRIFEGNASVQLPGADQALRMSQYDHFVGWRPVDEKLSSHHLMTGRRFYLIDVLASDRKPHLSVQPGRQTFQGEPCVVIVADEGRDEIWLSVRRGYALVRRLWRPSTGNEWLREYRCSDFVEVQTGMWLPKTCTSHLSARGSPESTSVMRLDIDRLAVNSEVPEALLRPSLPPGTHIYGPGGVLRGSVDGGHDLIDCWVLLAAKLFPPHIRASVFTPAAIADSLAIAGGMVCWLLAVTMFIRAMVEHRKSRHASCFR